MSASIEPPSSSSKQDHHLDVKSKPTFSSSLSHLLSPLLLSALANLGFAHPTQIQLESIPIALQGNDILARARTGSGKTLAYSLPAVQKILNLKQSLPKSDPSRQATRALILVPTRELAQQVTDQVNAILEFCQKEVSCLNAAREEGGGNVQRLLLSDLPDIVISTPSKALQHLQSNSLSLTSLQSLVIDEADLILSFGYSNDITTLLSSSNLSKNYQSFLMSATLSSQVTSLKSLFLKKDPIVLDLKDGDLHRQNLSQYFVYLSEEDKFLLIYVLLKLKLIRGKSIIFLNSIDRGFRLKLFLEQFGLKSCLLNSELPANSRFHIVQEFNKGVYDYIIATDEVDLGQVERDENEDQDEEEEEEGEAENEDDKELDKEEDDDDDDEEEETVEEEGAESKSLKRKRPSKETSKPSKKISKKSKSKKNHEYGVSRGIDFVAVSCVINFDLPTSARSYTHRIGRTARAGSTGTSISFVVPKDKWGTNLKGNVSCSTCQFDEKIFKRILKQEGGIKKDDNTGGDGGEEDGVGLKEWKYDRKQVEGFRYRMEDALRSVTKASVKEARIKEIKQEILNSEKLRTHFEDNPHDLAYLRHDKALHGSKVQSHMRHVPNYLMPRIMGPKAARPNNPSSSTSNGEGSDVKSERISRDEDGKSLGYVGLRNTRGGSNGRGRGRGGRGGRGSSRGGKKSDPLKKFGGARK